MLLVMAVSLVMASAFAAAQDNDGQFCLQAFEDRNENGQLDPGEPLITRGIGANLLNNRGIIVASALLDDSPTAARGVICFQNLSAGQYTMNVTSADFEATADDNMTVTVSGDGLPTIFEFGALPVDTGEFAAEAAPEPDPQAAVQRILVAVLGASVTMLLVGIIGLVLYLLFLRRPASSAPEFDPNAYYMRPPDARSTTGTMLPVQEPPPSTLDDTGQHPAQRPD